MEAPGGLKMGILIPSNDAGRLIGKQGAGLRQVREMSQCNIKLGQDPDSQGNRRCDISGPTVEHIASAVHAVATRIFEPGGETAQCKLFVAFPNEYVGAVIGK
ncbi:PCBP3, partial [Symbiodinium necroappetens]